jgi:glycosyltransferase involved in cell wall biosynthesis
VVTLGIIPYEEVIALYSRVNALVFPSYIETFGLPLTEAAFFGLPIIAADLPYAKEVLDGYEGVTFVNHQDAEAWGEAILKLCLTPTKCYSPFRKEGTNSWATLFEIIKQKI